MAFYRNLIEPLVCRKSRVANIRTGANERAGESKTTGFNRSGEFVTSGSERGGKRASRTVEALQSIQGY